MRYVMKQKLFSWGDDFYIRDAEGRDVFFVDGKAMSFSDQLSFRDLAGQELAFIKQKLFSLGATYEIHRNGALAAVVKKELFTFFQCMFNVDVPGPDDLQAKAISPITNTSSIAAARWWPRFRSSGSRGRTHTASTSRRARMTS